MSINDFNPLLDDLDFTILLHLQRDGRKSFPIPSLALYRSGALFQIQTMYSH